MQAIRIKTCFAFLLLLAVALVASHHAQAAACDEMTSEEVTLGEKRVDMLRTNRFAELNKEVERVQRAYEKGAINDEALLRAFTAFSLFDPALEAKYDAWVAAYPKSYVAREARAFYFRRAAYVSRGCAYALAMTKQQQDEVHARLKASLEDSIAASHLTAKPVLSYMGIVSLSKLEHMDRLAEDAFESARKIAPRNFIVRVAYMYALQTRWGGSLQQMNEQREEAIRAGLPPEKVRLFDEMVFDERDWVAKNGN